MIFKPGLIQKIRAGQKTQTRRPGLPRYKPGRSYALQPGRGKSGVGRIRVLEVRQEALGEISDADARREGFRNRWHFFDYWRSLHGKADMDQVVSVITFEFMRTEPVRLLRRKSGYTSSPALALSEEPEAVDAVTQRRLTEEARSGDADRARRRREEWERRTLEDRLRLVQSVAAERGVDVSGDLRVIERRVNAMVAKVHGERAA